MKKTTILLYLVSIQISLFSMNYAMDQENTNKQNQQTPPAQLPTAEIPVESTNAEDSNTANPFAGRNLTYDQALYLLFSINPNPDRDRPRNGHHWEL